MLTLVPRQITATSVNGVAVANDGSITLPIDTAPTTNSTNFVTSGGVKTELDALSARIGTPENPAQVWVDVSFTIPINSWSQNNNKYTATIQSSSILATSGVFVNYDNLDNVTTPIVAEESTGQVTFTTEKKPTGTITGTFRIIDSVNGIVPITRGGTGTNTFDSTPTNGSTKPVTSGGVYTALAAKAPLASPTFTGTPNAPTAAAGTNTTQLATTAFVKTALANNSGLSMPELGSFSTVAELNSALDAAVSDIPEGGILHFRIRTNAAFGLFVANAVYFGVLYKSAQNQYCHAMFYGNYILPPISGVRLADGWSYTSLLTGELTTTTLTATLRDGGSSGTAVATGTATIKRAQNFIDFTLSITDCNSVAITSYASITFSSSLPSQIPAYFPIMIRRGGQAYFMVIAQNAGTSLTIRGGDIGSQGNPTWTFESANTAIYAHEFVAI